MDISCCVPKAASVLALCELKVSAYVQIQAHAVRLPLSVTTQRQTRTVYLQEQRVKVPYNTILCAHPLLEHTNAAVLMNNVAGSFAAVICTSSFRHTPICTGRTRRTSPHSGHPFVSTNGERGRRLGPVKFTGLPAHSARTFLA